MGLYLHLVSDFANDSRQQLGFYGSALSFIGLNVAGYPKVIKHFIETTEVRLNVPRFSVLENILQANFWQPTSTLDMCMDNKLKKKKNSNL